jgi:serine/threonine-protein kinase
MIRPATIRTGQRLGKYRIQRKLAEGGFGLVYEALDTIEGVNVALKVPYPHLVDHEVLADFRKEVRLAARLDHANILSLKNAAFIDGHFVIVSLLGERTLGDRLQSRMALDTAIDFSEQMLEAAAYAHRCGIIHCDIKPENLILFPGNRLRLTDFGIAKVAQQTLRGSGQGTIGYIAPEQAMGKPSRRSDVFSIGLIMFRMFSGQLPEWPYEWPLPGYERLRARVHPDLIRFLIRAIELEPRKRFDDAAHMLSSFQRIKSRVQRFTVTTSRRKKKPPVKRDWEEVRKRQFLRSHGRSLCAHHKCHKCAGPVSESMQFCPWCSVARKVHRESTTFPAQCPRCHRGVKLDWRFCPWCYGAGFEPLSTRSFTDARYEARCTNSACSRKVLMPFMRYCAWCRRKVKKKWKITGSSEKCAGCGWGILKSFWSHCPWCGKNT